ncbi:MAG: thioredoxin [Clostridia bacterium]|nr:thioredoxin [Clostridia bacterium]
MAELILTNENFENEVLNSDIPVLVDFWAEWCGPCRMLGPVVEQIAEEYEGKLKVGKINVDEQRDLAMKYSIASIPTLLIFRNGEIAANSIGFKTKAALAKMLDELL